MIYKKVAFVNPPTIDDSPKMIRTFDCNTESKGNYLYQPYDFVLMSAKFREGYELIFVDCVADSISPKEALKKLKKEDPETFFIVVGENLFDSDTQFVEQVRAQHPESKIVVFGAPFVERWAQIKVRDYVDGILHNPLTFDPEKIVREREGLLSEEGFVSDEDKFLDPRRKAAREVNVGIPMHDLFLSRRYRWPFAESFKYTSVFISWGCPYSCSYCILNSFPNIYRSSNDVLNELEEIKKYGLREIYFADRSFGLPVETAKTILKGMIKRNFKFRWSSYFHPNQYDSELLRLMQESGCHTIIVGIETQDFNQLKVFGRHQKGDKLKDLIKDCKKYGIKICGDFIFGLPNQTREEVEKTISFSRDVGIDYASFNIAAPLPGSVIKKAALDDGSLRNEDVHYDSLGKYNALGNGLMSGNELIELRNKAVRSFYLRPSYLVKRLLTIRSLQQFIIQFSEMISILKKASP